MENLINQGLELAVLGMGTVFIFLTVLIFATRFMSTLVLRFEAESVEAPAAAVTQGNSPAQQARTIAIISAAITQHRKK